jgi:hypothetical protein
MSAPNAVSEHNKAMARAEFEIWNSGETERLDALVAPHVVHLWGKETRFGLATVDLLR